MKNFFLLIVVLLFALAAEILHAENIELIKILKAGDRNSAQIYLTFTVLPAFSKIVKGKRIDIIIEGKLQNTEPVVLQTDDRIVKFLTQTNDTSTIFTFFLRYEPQRIELATPQKNILVLDILLGNQFTKAYPDLSSKLQGVTIVQQKSEDYANPYISNPYRDNWQSFFSKYEPAISTSAPVKYLIPPFPSLHLLSRDDEKEILPEEIFALAQKKLWEDIIPLLLNLINTTSDPVSKKLYALTLGEVLMHSGDFNGAFKQLYLLKEKYQDDTVGILASYLLALLRANFEDPHKAEYELSNLEQYIDNNYSFAPYIYISQIETALATHQFEKVDKLMQRDDIALPGITSRLKQLRQADLWAATGKHIKAYVGYQLILDTNILDSHPFSLNGYCSTLYFQKKYSESSICYQQLTTIVNDKNDLSLIALKKAMAELHFKKPGDMYVIFSSIEDTYPGTIAGFRSAIKKTDIRYLSEPSWRPTSVKFYSALYEKATDRIIAEEAALKEAIAYAELGNGAKSIDLLLNFLRDFRNSDLTATAQALMIELLPAEIKRLVDDGKYIESLVLAKKNRELFAKNWIDNSLLPLLAHSYHKLNIFEEARKLYIYLLTTSEDDEKKKYFLPLISILHSQEKYDLVEDYAAQYNYNYPDGKDRDVILLLRLQSLVAEGNEKQALDLVSDSLPDLLPIKEIAASLYFKEKNYDRTIDILMPYWKENSLQSAESQFILAESLFQKNRFSEAEQIFESIKEIKILFDHSRYRLAIIQRNSGNEEKALKLFEEIVEKGNDPLWQKMATRELEFNILKNKY